MVARPSSDEVRLSLVPVREVESSLSHLALALSLGIDAAEGRETGHAARVSFVTAALTELMGLAADDRRALHSAALLHDVGVPAASVALSGLPAVDEELVFAYAPTGDLAAAEVPATHRLDAQAALHAHVQTAEQFLRRPWFPEDTWRAVEGHHENWDGSGYPHGRAADEIPLGARILRAADIFESLIAEGSNPLAARARACRTLAERAGRELDPVLVDALRQIAADDRFWLGLYDADLLEVTQSAATGGVDASPELLWAFSETVADLVDVKAGHGTGRSQRVAAYAARLGRALGVSGRHLELLSLAALWADVGALGVPSRALVKPDLLSLEEMQRMHAHPSISAEIVARIPGLAEVESWVAAHHERVDGKGYPDMSGGGAIGTEAGILSLAGAYVGMTSPRPYRAAMGHMAAMDALAAGTGTRWDPFLVDVFRDVIAADGDERSA